MAAARQTGRPTTSRGVPATAATATERRTGDSVTVTDADGSSFELDHGRVVIAAITSCTNTSNPSVMVGAGLLAKKAVERGLDVKPWVKTSLAPGSTVVTDYLERSGLDEYLNRLKFDLVGYGCTTCIGNSGPLPDEISAAVNDNDLVVCAVLSGNRNFEGRIQQDVKANYLASPPLCVAYALVGRMDFDFDSGAARYRQRRRAGLPARHLAERRGDPRHGRRRGPRRHVRRRTTRTSSRATSAGRRSRSPTRTATPGRTRPTCGSRRSSRGWTPSPPRRPSRSPDARVLAKLGDSITTDHISPAGAIKKDSPAGQWLMEQRGRGPRLQLLRLAPRQPRGDDAGHVRQRPPPQRARRPRGRLDAPRCPTARRCRSTTRR